MNENHLLHLNARKVIRCLASIISSEELGKVEDEVRRNVKQLLRLSQTHLRFARQAIGKSSWRQRVSRGYYSVYCISRAIRLEVNGHYNTDPSDHKNIGSLPDDFPSASRWKDFLTKFRADRNLADYDHTVNENALELQSGAYLTHAEEFLDNAKNYLKARGAI